MKNRIYWSSIEYKYEQKETNLLGGFVYVFLKASDVRKALEIILKEFKNERIIPIDIEFIQPYKPKLEWENPEQTEHYHKLYSSAKKSTNLIFDKFYAYEKIKQATANSG
jgi:hypothetical protein